MNIYSYNYYVYAYLRASDNTPYYIGKGKKDRAFSNKHIVSVPKDKSKIIFLEKNLSDIGALALERRYIRWYGRKDNNTGILRNLTDGGDGGCGYKHTEKHKKYISEKIKGRKHSLESIKKIKEKRKTQVFSQEHLDAFRYSRKNKLLSEEHKKKISINHFGIKHSKETKEKLSKVNSKGNYLFVCPKGNIFFHHSIIQFARENKLSKFLLYSNVDKGKIESKSPNQLTTIGKNTIGWQVMYQSSSSSTRSNSINSSPQNGQNCGSDSVSSSSYFTVKSESQLSQV